MDIRPRIQRRDLQDRIVSPQQAASLVEDGMHVGTSGFTPSGYPKATPLALAERVRNGQAIRLTLGTGASVGIEIDETWAELNMLARRYPYQTGPRINRRINSGDTLFMDIHLSQVAQQLRSGYLGKMDVAIVEAVCILENGGIVPSTSVGNAPVYVQQADRIIVEINTTQPLALMGMHDIYLPENPPHRKPIPLTDCAQRMGLPYIPCNPDRVAAVVPCDLPDRVRDMAAPDDDARAIARHLIRFFEKMYGPTLPPLQSGVGALANAVMAALGDSPYTNLTIWSEVLQDAVLDLMDAGKITVASGTSLSPSPAGLLRFHERIDDYRQRIVLRPQEISNHPEIARRIGLVAMNTAIEADIYGNTNSTHVLGTNMVNGIGGSGDFSRSAALVIMMTPSLAKGGVISCIVPHVTHVDHTEHEVHVLVTEQGLADLRGCDPREKAQRIIENCAHPDFRPLLWDYVQRAAKKGGHIPMLLDEAFAWHVRYLQSGSMKP